MAWGPEVRLCQRLQGLDLCEGTVASFEDTQSCLASPQTPTNSIYKWTKWTKWTWICQKLLEIARMDSTNVGFSFVQSKLQPFLPRTLGGEFCKRQHYYGLECMPKAQGATSNYCMTLYENECRVFEKTVSQKSQNITNTVQQEYFYFPSSDKPDFLEMLWNCHSGKEKLWSGHLFPRSFETFELVVRNVKTRQKRQPQRIAG